MDIFSHQFVVTIVLFAWKDQKINEKEAWDGPFKNINVVYHLNIKAGVVSTHYTILCNQIMYPHNKLLNVLT